ncbi:MAG: hypothetical protein H7282_05025 [Cytophagaceae bacterium]|nr:hypothetical protein [Cytophagaceae bacterium]
MILKINDRLRVRTVEKFNNFNLNLKHDAVASTFAFDFYYDPANSEHKQLACLSHYHYVTVEDNGELLLTGTLLSNVFNSSNVRELVAFGGYSKPGVLEDCQIPISAYPLQSDGLTLREIVTRILKPFQLNFAVDESVSAAMDKPYEKTTASNTQTCKDYICELATQRDIIVTHTNNGWLYFTKTRADRNPIFHFEQGQTGVSFSLSFNGQGIHSHITVVKEADDVGGNAGEVTIVNPYCPILYRPKVITQSSGDDIDTGTAAKNALAEELKNITIKITLSSWYINKKIIRPNQVISITNPELYIFKKTDFFIESVDLKGDNKSKTAVLTCVLKEVYNDQAPSNIFVSDHYKQNA